MRPSTEPSGPDATVSSARPHAARRPGGLLGRFDTRRPSILKSPHRVGMFTLRLRRSMRGYAGDPAPHRVAEERARPEVTKDAERRIREPSTLTRASPSIRARSSGVSEFFVPKEEDGMTKRSILTLVVLVVAVALAAPPASAQT